MASVKTAPGDVQKQPVKDSANTLPLSADERFKIATRFSVSPNDSAVTHTTADGERINVDREAFKATVQERLGDIPLSTPQDWRQAASQLRQGVEVPKVEVKPSDAQAMSQKNLEAKGLSQAESQRRASSGTASENVHTSGRAGGPRGNFSGDTTKFSNTPNSSQQGPQHWSSGEGKVVSHGSKEADAEWRHIQERAKLGGWNPRRDIDKIVESGPLALWKSLKKTFAYKRPQIIEPEVADTSEEGEEIVETEGTTSEEVTYEQPGEQVQTAPRESDIRPLENPSQQPGATGSDRGQPGVKRSGSHSPTGSSQVSTQPSGKGNTQNLIGRGKQRLTQGVQHSSPGRAVSGAKNTIKNVKKVKNFLQTAGKAKAAIGLLKTGGTLLLDASNPIGWALAVKSLLDSRVGKKIVGFLKDAGSKLTMAGASAFMYLFGQATAALSGVIGVISGIGGALSAVGGAVGALGAAVTSSVAASISLIAFGGGIAASIVFVFVSQQQTMEAFRAYAEAESQLITIKKTVDKPQLQNDPNTTVVYTVEIMSNSVEEIPLTIEDKSVTVSGKTTFSLTMPAPTAATPYPSTISKSKPAKIIYQPLSIVGDKFNDSTIINTVSVTVTPAEGEPHTETAQALIRVGTILDQPYGFPSGGTISSLDADPCGDHQGVFYGLVAGIKGAAVSGGIDIVGGPNAAVKSTLEGRVVATGWDLPAAWYQNGLLQSRKNSLPVGGYVYIQSLSGKYIAAFLHMNMPDFVKLAPGTLVKRGDVLGSIYPTAIVPTTTGPHVHYQVIYSQDGKGGWQNLNFNDAAHAGVCSTSPLYIEEAVPDGPTAISCSRPRSIKYNGSVVAGPFECK